MPRDSLHKKPSAKKQWLYAGILLCAMLILGTWWLAYENSSGSANTTQSEIKTTGQILLLSKEQEILESICISLRDEAPYTIQIKNNDSSFDIVEYPGFSIDYYRIASMLKHAKTLYAQEAIACAEEELKSYGLHEPRVTIKLQYQNNEEHTLRIGNTVPTQTSVYASLDQEPYVYILRASVFSAFHRSLTSLHALTFPQKIDTENIARIQIKKKGQPALEITASDDPLYNYDIVQPFIWHADSQRISEKLITPIAALSLSSYIINDPEKDYGLDSPAYSLYVQDIAGNVLALLLGNSDAENTYVRIDESDDIYCIPTSNLSFLYDIDVNNLTDSFVHLVAINTVKAVEVNTPHATYRLFIDHTKDGARVFRLNDADLSKETGQSLYESIISLQFDNTSDNLNIYSNTMASIRFFDLEGDELLLVSYLEYDDSYLAVQKNGETRFIIKKNRIEQLIDLLENAAAN